MRPYLRQVAGQLALGSVAGIIMNTAVVLPAILLGRAIDRALAHRLSTAVEADRIIVLDKGRIVEEGRPAELLGRGGRFAALMELEAAGWDWCAVPSLP